MMVGRKKRNFQPIEEQGNKYKEKVDRLLQLWLLNKMDKMKWEEEEEE